MKRYLALLLATLCMFSFVIAGCGSDDKAGVSAASGTGDASAGQSQSASSDAGTAQELSGKISFMSWGEEDERLLYEKVLENFQAKNPKVKVNYMFTPNDYYTKLSTMVAGNSTPDVFWLLQSKVPEYVKSGACAVLDPYIQKYPELTADLVDGLLKYGQVDGKTYTIPKDWAAINMYVNVDLFKKANIEIPTSDWTMEQYVDLAKKLTVTENGKIVQYGAEADNYWAFWMTFASSYGGQWFKDGKSNFSDPSVLKGMNVMYDIIKNKTAPSPSVLSSIGQGSDQLFLTGKIAMYPSGRWFVPTCRNDADFEWTAIEMPKGTTRINPVISGTLAMGEKSGNKDAAIGLIRYFLSEEGLGITMAGGLSMPPYKKMLDNEKIVTTPPDAAPFKATASYIETETQYNAAATGLYTKFQDIITPELDNAFNGSQTMEQAAANIDKKANTELFK